jgi:hypothetical protein
MYHLQQGLVNTAIDLAIYSVDETLVIPVFDPGQTQTRERSHRRLETILLPAAIVPRVV